MAKRLTRREFLMASLIGVGGGLAWLLSPHFAGIFDSQRTTVPAVSSVAFDPVVPYNFTGPVEVSAQGRKFMVNSLDQERAMNSYSMLVEQFAIPDTSLFREFSQKRLGDRTASYLWPYSGVVSAVAAMEKTPGGEIYQGELKRLLDGFELYYSKNSRLHIYDSYLASEGGGDKFYDDNQWVGLVFSDAYRIFKDPKYLEASQEIFDYSVSGWSDDLEGGIYWRQNDTRTKNVCSNGPAAAQAVMLYQDTHQQKYLDWAVRIMSWLERLKSPQSGVYWDNISTADGSIDRSTYTYNTGAPLQALAMLYTATGKTEYLDEARSLAASSYEHFARDDRGTGMRMFPDTPWFNVVLMRGYLALYQADPAKDRTYVDAMKQNLDYAWAHARKPDGSFSPDWSGKTGRPDNRTWILDQAAMVELYALIAQAEAIKTY